MTRRTKPSPKAATVEASAWLVAVSLRDKRSVFDGELWFRVVPTHVPSEVLERDCAELAALTELDRMLYASVKRTNMRLYQLPDLTYDLALPPEVRKGRAGSSRWAVESEVWYESKVFSSRLYFFFDGDGRDEDDAFAEYRRAVMALFKTRRDDPPLIVPHPNITRISAAWSPLEAALVATGAATDERTDGPWKIEPMRGIIDDWFYSKRIRGKMRRIVKRVTYNEGYLIVDGKPDIDPDATVQISVGSFDEIDHGYFDGYAEYRELEGIGKHERQLLAEVEDPEDAGWVGGDGETYLVGPFTVTRMPDE